MAVVTLLLFVLGIFAAVVLITTAFDQPDSEFCESCEYELRGLPSRRCPECGHANHAETARRKVPHPVMLGIGITILVICLIPIALVVVLFLSYLSGMDI